MSWSLLQHNNVHSYFAIPQPFCLVHLFPSWTFLISFHTESLSFSNYCHAFHIFTRLIVFLRLILNQSSICLAEFLCHTFYILLYFCHLLIHFNFSQVKLSCKQYLSSFVAGHNSSRMVSYCKCPVNESGMERGSLRDVIWPNLSLWFLGEQPRVNLISDVAGKHSKYSHFGLTRAVFSIIYSFFWMKRFFFMSPCIVKCRFHNWCM